MPHLHSASQASPLSRSATSSVVALLASLMRHLAGSVFTRSHHLSLSPAASVACGLLLSAASVEPADQYRALRQLRLASHIRRLFIYTSTAKGLCLGEGA